MLIAQITDLHIGFEGREHGENCPNLARAREVLVQISAMKQQPDLLIVTGDMAEPGQGWAYAMVRDFLNSMPFPHAFTFGNHDRREGFKSVFGDDKFNDGFLQYVVEDYPVRIIMIDTLTEGRHGGTFCERRAQWLDDRLAEQPDRPTLLALHHPPIETGIPWMSARSSAAWVKRITNVVKRYDNVVHVIAGHTHRPIFKRFAGTTLSVCPAICPQVMLELAPMDLDVPDGRALIVDSAPGFALHQWDGAEITTHISLGPPGDVIVAYDEKYADLPRYSLDKQKKPKG